MHHRALNEISSVVRNTVDRDSDASHYKWATWAALAHEPMTLKASRGEDAPSASALTPAMEVTPRMAGADANYTAQLSGPIDLV